jgi:hypothetical protein
MTTAKEHPNRAERSARLTWVPIRMMRVSTNGQRDLNQARVDHLAADFDLERLGTPTVNKRDGNFYIIDGQHRIRAMEAIGWGDQQIQCWAYEGMTEAEEAEMFLRLNDVLVVSALPKFRAAVAAGREDQVAIDQIVRKAGFSVSYDKNSIRAVGTLEKVYRRGGGPILSRALGIVRDAYGIAGMQAPIIDGIGLLCQRYNGTLDVPTAVTRLANVHGGCNGLLNTAERIRMQTGHQRGHCVAAAAVSIINAGRGGKKLAPWWKADDE